MDTTTPPTQIRSTDLFCPYCGYNLRGTDSSRCTECGRCVSLADLSTSRIPWTHRKSVGRVRAFLRTINMATFHSPQLAESFHADLTWKDGRRFRLICILPLALTAIILLLANRGWEFLGLALSLVVGRPAGKIDNWVLQLGVPWYFGMLYWLVIVLTVLAFFLALSMLPVRLASFVRYPASLRDSALGAAQYVAGALPGGIVLGIFAAMVIAAVVDVAHKTFSLDWGLQTVAVVAPATALLTWTLASYRFHRKSAITSGARIPPFPLLFPALLLLTITIWLIALPWYIGLLCMIVHTLTSR